MKNRQWILLIALAVAGAGALFFWRAPSAPTDSADSLPEDVFLPPIAHELFLATRTDERTVAISFYNTDTEVIDAEAELVSPDPVVSVQFNASTQQVVYETSGVLMGLGDGCINADKTCNARLYLSDGPLAEPVMLFDTTGVIGNWVVDPVNSVVLLTAFSKDEGDTFKKIDLQSKAVVYSAPFVGLGDSGAFTLSMDQQSVYRVLTVNTRGVTTIKVQTFSVATGEMSEKQIYQGKDQIEASWAPVSPNGKQLAVWVGPQDASVVYLFDLGTLSYRTVTPNALVQNYRIVWSGDSSAFSLLEQGVTERVDVQSLEATFIDPNVEYVFTWNALDRLLAQTRDNASLRVIDPIAGTTSLVSETVRGADSILGASFFQGF